MKDKLASISIRYITTDILLYVGVLMVCKQSDGQHVEKDILLNLSFQPT